MIDDVMNFDDPDAAGQQEKAAARQVDLECDRIAESLACQAKAVRATAGRRPQSIVGLRLAVNQLTAALNESTRIANRQADQIARLTDMVGDLIRNAGAMTRRIDDLAARDDGEDWKSGSLD